MPPRCQGAVSPGSLFSYKLRDEYLGAVTFFLCEAVLISVRKGLATTFLLKGFFLEFSNYLCTNRFVHRYVKAMPFLEYVGFINGYVGARNVVGLSLRYYWLIWAGVISYWVFKMTCAPDRSDLHYKNGKNVYHFYSSLVLKQHVRQTSIH